MPPAFDVIYSRSISQKEKEEPVVVAEPEPTPLPTPQPEPERSAAPVLEAPPAEKPARAEKAKKKTKAATEEKPKPAAVPARREVNAVSDVRTHAATAWSHSQVYRAGLVGCSLFVLLTLVLVSRRKPSAQPPMRPSSWRTLAWKLRCVGFCNFAILAEAHTSACVITGRAHRVFTERGGDRAGGVLGERV